MSTMSQLRVAELVKLFAITRGSGIKDEAIVLDWIIALMRNALLEGLDESTRTR